MAGYNKIYCVGGEGGYMGADGINPIELFVLVGDGNRQWLQPVYVNGDLKPLGQVKTIIPPAPDLPVSIYMSLIFFYPAAFAGCKFMADLSSQMRGIDRIDFNLGINVPGNMPEIVMEARQVFGKINIWSADFTKIPILHRFIDLELWSESGKNR